ncbi:hypothetical protein MRX96_042105 [Rhipicephalus microplus]
MQGQLWEILADNEDSMAEASIWDSFMQKAFHLDSQYHGRHDVFLLAKYVVESGEIEHNGSHVPLPEFCSASETRVCHLVKLLPTLNELLYYLGAEVTEVAPGRIAVRCYRSIYLELTIESGFRMVEAVMVLYCIVAKHRCIDILEVTLQPRQQYDISSLMSCVLQRMSSLRSFALKGSELTDDATTIAFKAIARLLRSQLAELSLECLDLAKPSQKACASLDAFETALSASRKLKRLKIVEVLIESEAQRNYGLLQCAAAFALGSSHKRAAVAYERVSWHPQLCKTIKSMGNLSTGEAMERIQQSNRRLRDQTHFCQLCGIVQGRFVCHEAPAAADGASVRQLDNVGEDVLQLIRSYLKVGDILDDEEELP